MEFNVENFIKFENDNKLFDREINSFKYWAFVRVIIYFIFESNLIKDKKSSDRKNEDRNVLNFIKRLLIGLFLFIKTPLYIRKKDLLLFQCAQRNLIDGKKQCRFTYSIVKHFGASANVISDSAYFNGHLNDDKFSMDFMNSLAVVYYKIFYRVNGMNKIFVNEADYLIDLLNKCFNIQLSQVEINKVIVSTYCLHKFYKKRFISLLKKTRPKCIIYQEYYNVAKMTLNEIARLENIDTVELQHGVIGKGHIAYNFGHSFNRDILPNKLFYWGKHWIDTARFPIVTENKLSVGFPYHDDQVKRFLQNNHNLNTKRILVISDGDFSDKVLNIIEELLYRFNNNRVSYKLVYKLHPKEFSLPMDRYNKILIYKNVEIIKDLKKDLYFLLSNNDYVIGKYSTVLYEATSYSGELLILYDEDYFNYTKPLVDNNYAKYFSDAECLYNQILNCQNNYHRKMRFKNNIFFENNSLENMKNYLKREIGK